jgi:hypothetical protein
MSKVLRSILAVALILIVILGLGISLHALSHPHSRFATQHVSAPTSIIIGDPDLIGVAGEMWKTEAARRFPNCVILLAHGQDLSGVFYTFPDGILQTGRPVETEMDLLQSEYPGRTVLILSCNPEGVAIHGHKGCYYFPNSVWVIPDRDTADEGIQGLVPLMLGGVWHVPHHADENPFESPKPVNRWATDSGVCGNVFEAISAE